MVSSDKEPVLPSNSNATSTAPDGIGNQEESGNIARGAWGGQLEFILTCVGYAVGLGNVWRFPYLTYQNGGGAFIIPYALMLAFVGLPVFYLELAFGQFASLGPITIWTLSPILKGIGCGMIAVSWLIGLYYNIIIAWSVFYLFSSFTSHLPFTDCNNPTWNNDRCITGDDLKVLNRNESLMNMTLIARNLTSKSQFQSPSEQFYFNKVLQRSDSIDDFGEPVWQLVLCLFLCWLTIFLVLIKGISSLGKVVYFVTIFPYIMMTILLVRGATLEGARTGIEFYLKPDPAKLADATVWSDAATQIFFSLSACSGGLIAMASYNNFNNNCYRDSVLVPVINCCTSVYAGFAIFSILGYLANEKGVPVSEVAESGPGLVFVVYPEALTLMPVPTLWSILFFLMLITLGFSSEFSIVEAVFVSIMDEFPDILRKNEYRPVIFRAVCCSIFFLITIPMVCNGGFYLFNLVDTAMSGFPLLIVGILEVTALMYIYGYKKFEEDIKMMTGKAPTIYFQACWRVITPILILVIIIFVAVQYKPLAVDGVEYPGWGQALYWLVTIFTLVWLPVFFLYVLCKNGAWQLMLDNFKPTREWGPALEENRYGRYNRNLWEAERRVGNIKRQLSRDPSRLSLNSDMYVNLNGSLPVYTKQLGYSNLDRKIGRVNSDHSYTNLPALNGNVNPAFDNKI